MKKYNPYLQMAYDTRTNKLIMTPETFKMWAETFEVISEEQKEYIYKVFKYFTRKEN